MNVRQEREVDLSSSGSACVSPASAKRVQNRNRKEREEKGNTTFVRFHAKLLICEQFYKNFVVQRDKK